MFVLLVVEFAEETDDVEEFIISYLIEFIVVLAVLVQGLDYVLVQLHSVLHRHFAVLLLHFLSHHRLTAARRYLYRMLLATTYPRTHILINVWIWPVA